MGVRHWQVVCFVLAVGAALLGIDARATYDARVSADEPQYLLTAISLAEDIDLDISDEIRDEAYRPFHEVRLDQQTIELNDDGQRISPHDPLLPLMLAVPMRWWGWVGAKATMAVVAGLTAAATASLAVRRFGVEPRIAGMVVSAFFVVSPLAAYGNQIYPALPAALCVVVGLHAATSSSWWSAPVAAAAVVALPWLSVKYTPLAGVLALTWFWSHRREANQVWALLAVLCAAGIAYVVVHQRVWGGWTVYASGDHFVGGEFEVVGTNVNYVARTNRLLGLLVDRYFGLAAWAPAYVLAPAGLANLWFRTRPDADNVGARSPSSPSPCVALLALVVAAWAVATWIALTMHGFWWSGRQVVPVLPLVAIAVATLVDDFRGLARPLLAVTVWGLLNWAWIAFEASTGRRALIVDHEETSNPFFQAWKEVLPDHRVDGLSDQLMTAAWGVVFAASVGWVLWRRRLRPAVDGGS